MRKPISPEEARTAPRVRPSGPVLNFLSKIPVIESFREYSVWLDRRAGFQENFFGASQAFKGRVNEIEELLKAKEPDGHHYPRIIHAEERAAFEWICEARALPRDGATDQELEDLGLRVEPPNTAMGALRLVDLPEGWSMTPQEDDPSHYSTSHGFVLDQNGETVLNVFYRASLANNKQIGRVSIHLSIESPEQHVPIVT